MGFNLENQAYFESLLNPISSDKNLVAEDYIQQNTKGQQEGSYIG